MYDHYENPAGYAFQAFDMLISEKMSCLNIGALSVLSGLKGPIDGHSSSSVLTNHWQMQLKEDRHAQQSAASMLEKELCSLDSSMVDKV